MFEELIFKLESCGFTYSECTRYAKAILKKQTLPLKELQYRLTIKFGVSKGKALYEQITTANNNPFNYNHMIACNL